MKQETLLSNALKKCGSMGSMSVPVHRTSTIAFSNPKEYVEASLGNSKFNIYEDTQNRNHGYSTVGTPTYQNLANVISSMEGHNSSTLLYPNGLMALTTVAMTFAKNGSHVLIQDNCYNAFKKFMINVITQFGIITEIFDPTLPIDHLIKENTSLIMLESPGSYTFEITDIDSVIRIAKTHNIITALDNSWAGPLFFKPLEHGIDISIYSLTKTLSGHSDLLMGASVSKGKVFQQINAFYSSLGISVSPDDCYLAHRGIKTAFVRSKQQEQTVLKVANWLIDCKNISAVLCPSINSHPQHHLWKKYFSGTSPLFSFVLDKQYSDEDISIAIEKMLVFSVGVSWGGCESLIMPCFNKHIELAPRSVMQKNKKSIVRISCGLENAEDLINDLKIFLYNLCK